MGMETAYSVYLPFEVAIKITDPPVSTIIEEFNRYTPEEREND